MSKTSKSMWLRRVGPLSLAGALVLPWALSGAESAKPAAGKNYQEIFDENLSAKKSLFDDIEKQRRAALEKASNGEYGQAVKDLEALSKNLAKYPGRKPKDQIEEIAGNIKRINGAWSSELMQNAQKLAKEKKFNEAIALAQQAQVLTPSRSYISSFISECQKSEMAGEFRKETSLQTVSPEYAERQKQIDLDLREAKIFFRNKRYESACTRLERVLLVDPFNVEAIDLLALTYDRLYNIGINRGQESNLLHNARDVWEWIEPLAQVQVDRTTDRRGTVRQRSNTDLYNRLERIIFPSVPLKDSTLTQIISYLNEKSRTYDQDKEGVTIIDNLSVQDKQRRISFEHGRMPLLDIIRYLSMASGLSYSFRGDKVVFGNVDNMSTEFFPVRGDIIAEIIDSYTVRQTSSGMKEVEGGGGGDAPAEEAVMTPDSAEVGAEAAPAAGGNSDQERTSAALKSYFTERWVTFDDGANIIYSPRGERLMVRNTAENLRRMDALLRQLDALDQPMIMVEAKLIELSDTNLNELGFEWLFAANHSGSHPWRIGTVDPTRHGDGAGLFRVVNNLKILPNFGKKIFGSDVNVDLSLSVNAVAQNRRAEVLASPRILSESGSKIPAMIKMTEKTYFITEWEEPDVETDGFNITLDSTDPEWDDEAYDLGVTFTVQPTVQADNYTITLNNIHPIFLSHVGNHDYVVSYEAGQYIEGQMIPVMKQTFNLSMPEIARREMTTSITLYDGETVLLGGMADNESIARDDKWPLLGDIPLLGNFFRDQYTKMTNRTMLIFITARLINPNGVPVRSVRDQGLIDFNR